MNTSTPETDAEVLRIENDEKQYPDRYDCFCALANFTRKFEHKRNEWKQKENSCQIALTLAQYRARHFAALAAPLDSHGDESQKQ